MWILRSERAIIAKACLFVLLAVSAASLLLLKTPEWSSAALLVICVWAAARSYYFAFYVVERYIESGFRYSGLGSVIVYFYRRRRYDRRMQRFLPLLIAVALASPLVAQTTPPSADELFHRGLAPHDSGDYDGAIAIYKQILAATPDNELVKYELAFSTYAKGDMAESIRLATEGASKAGEHQVAYLELLGIAYDALHKTREAIEAYKRGIKVAPNYPRIHFNLGLASAGENNFRDAREELEKAIELDPMYASPQFAIADVYRLDEYRVPAILAYGRFLALEPEGARAAIAAQRLQTLLNLGVTTKGGGNVNITINPDTKKTSATSDRSR